MIHLAAVYGILMKDAEAMAEAIKNLEPALRVKGQAPDFDKFNVQFQMGQFSEESTLKEAIDNSAGDKVEK